MESRYEKEIIELHQFFEDWFTGRLPKTREAFDRMEKATGDEFVIVMPQGKKVGRGPLLTGLFEAHGAQKDLRIWIEKVRIHAEDNPLVVIEYEEWQKSGGEPVSRYSTAIFRKKANGPNELEWVHVHETWFNNA